MSLLQEKVKKHLEERGWGVSPPGDFAKAISIEAAELLEHFQWSNPTAAEIKTNPQELKELSHEMADVVIFALEFCIVLGIDFETAVLEKLILAQKKYPIEKVKGSDENYWKIKKEYRQKS